MELIYLSVLVFALQSQAYKFLMYEPIFGYSHTKFMGSIADALTEAGHDVTILMSVLDEDQEKLADSLLTKKLIRVGPDPRTAEIIRHRGEKMSKMWTMQPTPFDWLRNVISDDTLMQELRSMEFVAGIAETFTICGFGELAVEGDQMNLFDRLRNAIDTQISKMFLQHMYEKGIDAFRAKFGQHFKGYDELLTQASYVLTNSNPYIDFPRPMLHQTVPIGGITLSMDRKKAALNETWNAILSERRYTVLISFGTVSKAAFMPEKYKEGLLEVFKSMPDTTFLWKYEGAEIDLANIPNVYLSTWFPQYALLSDNRLTAFITHAGLGSVTEAAFLGKPTIFVSSPFKKIPVFSDQARNAKMMVRHRGGILMSKFDLEYPSKLKENLLSLINDKSYAENAKRLSDLLLNLPLSAKELAVKHCEFAARFGRTINLDAYGRHLPFVQYYLIDVFLVIGLILSVVLFLTFKLVNALLLSARKKKLD